MFHTKKGFYTTGFYLHRTWIVRLCKLVKSTYSFMFIGIAVKFYGCLGLISYTT